MVSGTKGKQSSWRKETFGRALARWFQKHGRDLPWRRTRDPYAVMVSEVMLQQTQVATVIPYYNEWMRRFPDVRALARASETLVLRTWQGLGYYSRARNLHRSSRAIIQRLGGTLPRNPDELRTLPGIGRYTANAIAVFAFDRSFPLIEANTARVLARLFNISEPIDSSAGRAKLWQCSAQLVPKNNARDFHSALMDLGALVCTARDPRCSVCPVKKCCAASIPVLLPYKRHRAATVRLLESHELVIHEGTILLEQCRRRWRGMSMLPVMRRIAANPIYVSRFPFTHHQITLQVFRGRRRRSKSSEHWRPISALDRIPIPLPHRRAINALLAA
jgi:A/G-specific adenine glycosylase